MYMILAIRDWRRRDLAHAVLVGVGEEADNPAITAGEVADYITGLVGYEVQVVFGIEGGDVPLPLAPATYIDLHGPRTLYFRAL